MPRTTLSLDRLSATVGRATRRSELEERLFASKVELEKGEGDELAIEGTADRLDLLTEAGLALYLQGALGLARGLPPMRSAEPHGLSLTVDTSVDPIRPAIAAVVVDPPEGHRLDAGLLAEAIRYQELLHATVGSGRRVASLGIYPVSHLHGPIRYASESITEVRFTPLEATAPVDGPSFFATHPMAAQYGAFGRAGEHCLTLRDARGTILSLPPILNSREAGEAAVGDDALLLESTGTSATRVADAVGLLSMVFVVHGWGVAPVPIQRAGGPAVTPRTTSPRNVHLSAHELDHLAGRSYPSPEAIDLLERSRFSAVPGTGGWSVEVPAWRPDVQTGTDLAEDILLAKGVRSEDGLLPASRTRGTRSPAARFRARISALLLGLGFVPLYTPVLVAGSTVRLTGRSEAIALANPVSDQLSHLRDAMFPSLVATLGRNRRAGYPQRFSEIGPVVVRDREAETGASTGYRAGALLAGERAAFADGAAWIDYVLRTLGTAGVREPAEIAATIPGRAAVVRLAGETVGWVGELAPAVLADLGVPVPAVWAELDLTALQPLIGDRASNAL